MWGKKMKTVAALAPLSGTPIFLPDIFLPSMSGAGKSGTHSRWLKSPGSFPHNSLGFKCDEFIKAANDKEGKKISTISRSFVDGPVLVTSRTVVRVVVPRRIGAEGSRVLRCGQVPQ